MDSLLLFKTFSNYRLPVKIEKYKCLNFKSADSKCAMPSNARGNTRKSKDYNQSTINSISTVEKLNQTTR